MSQEALAAILAYYRDLGVKDVYRRAVAVSTAEVAKAEVVEVVEPVKVVEPV
ncbi:MAG: hypothetical protein JNK48_26210, partial [Bryobacterales bacterium]|nr:hypothetical protein [Bryobacterales bacterium]